VAEGPAARQAPFVWAPRWASIVGLALAGACLAGVAAAGDPVGAVLAGSAGLAFVALAGYDLVVRPTLVAGGDGITVRVGWHPRHYAWADVTRVEVTAARRVIVTPALEIDAGGDLLVLGRRRLGADLSDVAERLAGLGAPVVARPPR
jgi:hypothetical protein